VSASSNNLQLLVEWSSPWEEFVSSIRPALRKSPPALALEAKAGLFPWRGLVLSALLEVAILAAATGHSAMQPVALETSHPAHDVIYFSADELPQMKDVGGASAGLSGRSGGSSARTPRQIIKVARGEALRPKVADAPEIDLPKSDSALRNLLAYKAEAGPAPAEALKLARPIPQIAARVVPPPPQLLQDALRRTQLSNAAVAPPPVELPRQDVPSRHSFSNPPSVVPPPVSAPVQATSHPARLTLPAQAVVAPQPNMNQAPVRLRQQNNEFAARVVPPAIELSALRTPAQAAAFIRSQTVVPPPVQVQNLPQRTMQTLGAAAVVPPVADINSLHHQRALQNGGAAVVAPFPATVVTPAQPSRQKTASSSSATGDGSGSSSVSSNTGVVVSPQPGNNQGAPANSEKATLAMSPSGSAALGAGGEGGGGIAHGNSSGSRASGLGSGASSTAMTSSGRGANASDHTGSSTYPGPGGAGNASHANSRVPGVSVSGGNNTITLPSFGGPPAASMSAAGHSSAHGTANGITVVASPRAGGAMNYYGMLKGDRVYTIYIQTPAGMASMQYADPASASQPYASDLTAPEAIRTDAPSDVPAVRLVVLCALDRSGVLKNLRVLQSDATDFQKKILAALPEWKFSPAFRGQDPVEVNVILGFGVDTK
jgi:hypothetical protein